MGKPNEGLHPANNEAGEQLQETPNYGSCWNACASSICTVTALKRVVALMLCVNLLVFGVFSLPIFGKRNAASSRPASGNKLQAQIQGSFRLQKPVSALNANIHQLELAILGEVGVPYTKVEVTSLEPLNATISTEVIFGVLPNPENMSIPSYSIFGLRETFISLLLGSSNLSLKSEGFGDAHHFELLKFPGGITFMPEQRVFPLQRKPFLFNFTLHSTIAQVVQNLAQLRKQLSIGLHVLPIENVAVQLTNLQGSTVDPPVIVETSIFPVVGKKGLPPPRLRQLAHEINPAGNLGLNHTLFGKVKQIQLSSYLRYPSSPPPYHPLSPAPSPSHRTFTSHISPSPSHSYPRPMHAMPPSNGEHAMVPSPYHRVLAPVSHHHAKSHQHYHRGMPPYYHHVVAPSSHHPHHCCHQHQHHAHDPVKCRQQHLGPAPIYGLNGKTPSPSPDITKPFRYCHHRKAASAPHAMTVAPPAFSPRNSLSSQSPHWDIHLPPVALVSPASTPGFPSHSLQHSAPKSAPASNARVSSPKSSHLSPEGLSHSPSPQKSWTADRDLPIRVSPALASSYVSSSSFAANPVQLIIGSLVFVGIILSVLA